ncbi:rRNA maturation RNase YbeY [Anaeromyxobacter oryzisoli]|uniref:rRNA maturation RNase YbeY n=1 Tax=Anaeromyxobacter oryzisoli TaxID=2925408 RepID=UPI001F55CF40|nr:rRNA maturation RNase YbeY [Anaeromyxobacter sp. SG63]
MIVRLSSEHPDGARAARRLRGRAATFLAAVGRDDAELSILLVTDRRIRSLNREWRGKDRATDVLSFPMSEPAGSGSLLGDVVISLDTATRRSRAEGRPVGAELDRYLAHGILHLLGYDHEREEDARVMAAKEAELARAEGLVGAALRSTRRVGRAGVEGRWTRSQTSISTPSPSGSTTRGTRAKSSRAGSRR